MIAVSPVLTGSFGTGGPGVVATLISSARVAWEGSTYEEPFPGRSRSTGTRRRYNLSPDRGRLLFLRPAAPAEGRRPRNRLCAPGVCVVHPVPPRTDAVHCVSHGFAKRPAM